MSDESMQEAREELRELLGWYVAGDVAVDGLLRQLVEKSEIVARAAGGEVRTELGFIAIDGRFVAHEYERTHERAVIVLPPQEVDQ